MSKTVCACCGTNQRNNHPQWCPMPDVYVRDDSTQPIRTMSETSTLRTDAACDYTSPEKLHRVALEMERELAAARAELAALKAELDKLSDPVAVHINMLRGTIATPSFELMEHVWGQKSEPTPLDRPDQPGWWWMWLPTNYCEGEGDRWTIAYFGPSDLPYTTDKDIKHWLSAVPPRDLREGEA